MISSYTNKRSGGLQNPVEEIEFRDGTSFRSARTVDEFHVVKKLKVDGEFELGGELLIDNLNCENVQTDTLNCTGSATFNSNINASSYLYLGNNLIQNGDTNDKRQISTCYINWMNTNNLSQTGCQTYYSGVDMIFSNLINTGTFKIVNRDFNDVTRTLTIDQFINVYGINDLTSNKVITSRLTLTGYATMTGTLTVSDNLSLNGSAAINRQMNASYYNMSNINSASISPISRFYSDLGNLYIEHFQNEASIKFAVRNNLGATVVSLASNVYGTTVMGALTTERVLFYNSSYPLLSSIWINSVNNLNIQNFQNDAIIQFMVKDNVGSVKTPLTLASYGATIDGTIGSKGYLLTSFTSALLSTITADNTNLYVEHFQNNATIRFVTLNNLGVQKFPLSVNADGVTIKGNLDSESFSLSSPAATLSIVPDVSSWKIQSTPEKPIIFSLISPFGASPYYTTDNILGVDGLWVYTYRPIALQRDYHPTNPFTTNVLDFLGGTRRDTFVFYAHTSGVFNNMGTFTISDKGIYSITQSWSIKIATGPANVSVVSFGLSKSPSNLPNATSDPDIVAGTKIFWIPFTLANSSQEWRDTITNTYILDDSQPTNWFPNIYSAFSSPSPLIITLNIRATRIG